MSSVEEAERHSLHPAKDGWKPILPQASHAILFYPGEVAGAGVEARFLEDVGLRLRGVDDRLREWLAFLDGVNDANGALARALWEELYALGERVPVPQAGPLPDGGFQFVWDHFEHHLEVDILPDRSFEWFYRNRRTGQVAGEDTPAGPLPEQLRNRLALFE